MTASADPGRPRESWLRPRLICFFALLTVLASLKFTAYEQWSGPTPGWAAPAFALVGSLVFFDWLGSGAPASLGPHDPDLGRVEMIACVAGHLANVLLVASLVLGMLGWRRLARTLGRIALCFGIASIMLLKIGVRMFELGPGAYLWLAAMGLLAFSRLNRLNEPSTLTAAAD